MNGSRCGEGTGRLRIGMSEQRPVEIAVSEWSEVGHAESADGSEFVRVLQNAKDDRRIVYGANRATEAGFLVSAREEEPDEAETVRAIRRVAGLISAYPLGTAAIASLPPERL